MTGLLIFLFENNCAASLLADRQAGTNEFRSDRILVKPKAGAAKSSINRMHQLTSASIRARYERIGDLQVVQLPPGMPVATALKLYRESGTVEYAEPDYIVRAARVPNEASYANGPLWNLFNWGQLGGIAGADIDAAAGWDLESRASGIIVSVIDSGIRVTHQDLAANMWVNPGEIPGNGIDDDGNGYIDDVHGINAITGTGDLVDEPNHGTHVAGTLGAVGDNGIGIVGVAWDVQIMGCKFLDAQFEGTISDAVECIEYSRVNGAKIINASWGGRTSSHFHSQALRDAIASLRADGIIFVAAAGNFSLNNDSAEAFYPASFDLDNIISVAATTREDMLAEFSCYGASSVDLGAPGYKVYSCWATADDAYDYDNGTSMAAPHVAAACALAWTRFPNENYLQIIERVLTGVDVVPALAGKFRTSGRLNLRKVLDDEVVPGPPVLVPLGSSGGTFHLRVVGIPHTKIQIQSSTDLQHWTTIHTNQLSSEGLWDFADATPGVGARGYRAMIAP